MPTILSIDLLKKYMKPNNKRHPAYKLTCELAESVKVHADGTFPKKLIAERRPGESATIRDYREKIFKSPTKGDFGKVMTELGKIRKSEDWMIKYDESKQIAGRLGEKLFDYCEQDFPLGFGSVTNWVFNILLKCYVVDPNSVILVMPLEIPDSESTYLSPFPFIFPSENVYDFSHDDFCILYSTDKSTFTDGKTVRNDGDIFYAVDTERIQRWEQVDSKGTMDLVIDYEHHLSRMPAFKIGANFYKVFEKHFIYESRLANAIPSFDEAAREYSDLQAEVVQHIHSLLVSHSNQVCKKCTNGKIFQEGKDSVEGRWISCNDCKGSGYIPFNPYEHLVMRPPSATEGALPNPVAYYVTKDIKIVEIQDQRIKDHRYNGLAAINMEWLAEVPLNQSGKAKEVDRDGLNTYVSTIAEDIVRVMDLIYGFINDYRYGGEDEIKRKGQLPKIPVPQKFDLLSANYLVEELVKVRQNKAFPTIIAAIESEYANAKFNNDDHVRNELIAIFDLDPFPGLGDDDKLLRLQNSGISKEDYVISCNIQQFVSRAIKEAGSDTEFMNQTFELKRQKMIAYAQEVISKNSAGEAVMRTLVNNQNQGQGNQFAKGAA